MGYHVIIPAAGRGTRMGKPYNKLLIELDGMTIIERTVKVFQEDNACEGIHLALNPNEETKLQSLLTAYDKVTSFIAGGRERQESIFNVIQSLELNPETVVMVHDGARPFVSHETIEGLFQQATLNQACLTAVRAKDTIKVVEDGQVVQTLDRRKLWQVQTPQAFQFGLLKEAYQYASETKFEGTDDASLVEHYGTPIQVVEGNYNNIKLTTTEDLDYGLSVIQNRGDLNV
ncbi:2-C-methyl-D-erythritol 4-phosphate cytidylyltransferase [Staphylococcus massiliensis]|uniref:2-C-methyl-D-erythritol 4-phosphate cytidylyltransferase n=1 Tax=Staphylococcus massiliensis TaxID=555791 RepID=UPI00370D024D